MFINTRCGVPKCIGDTELGCQVNWTCKTTHESEAVHFVINSQESCPLEGRVIFTDIYNVICAGQFAGGPNSVVSNLYFLVHIA